MWSVEMVESESGNVVETTQHATEQEARKAARKWAHAAPGREALVMDDNGETVDMMQWETRDMRFSSSGS